MPEKKYIVMLQGIGNNESAWARIISNRGEVFLIQRGAKEHIEIWEWGKLKYFGPYLKLPKPRVLNAVFYDPYAVIRMFYLTLRLTRGLPRIDLIIATSNYYGLAALLWKKLGKAKRMVSFLQDYFPIRGSLPVRLYRKFHYLSSRFVAARADEVWKVSPRIKTARINPRNFLIPIYINVLDSIPEERTEIAYLGHPTPDHALIYLFEFCRKHQVRLNILGESPYLSSIRDQAPAGTVFHGFHSSDKIHNILRRCFCGYAIYLELGPGSHSYYGIPSKLFRYLASGVPVLTTDTAYFSPRIAEYGLGKLVDPTYARIESALLEIRDNYPAYYQSIRQFRREWNKSVENFFAERLNVLLRD
jgi:glycosyltransferase involved in cell wall biosynthesis